MISNCKSRLLLTILVLYTIPSQNLAQGKSENPLEIINGNYPMLSSNKQFIYRSINHELTGKGAKYIIAGRILNNSVCDNSIFDISAASQLESRAKGDIKKEKAIKRGKGDAISFSKLPLFCDYLEYDAANWSLTNPLTASEDVLENAFHLAAVEQNNCNWDFDSEALKNFYPQLNDQTELIAGVKANLIRSKYTSNGDQVADAEEKGIEYGLSLYHEITPEKCGKLANFASRLDW